MHYKDFFGCVQGYCHKFFLIDDLHLLCQGDNLIDGKILDLLKVGITLSK